MLKRFAILITFVFSVVLIYEVYLSKENEIAKDTKWHGLKKDIDKQVVGTPVPERINKGQGHQHEHGHKAPRENQNRMPASLQEHSPFISDAPEWKRDLGEELLQSEDSDAEVYIKEEKRISKIEHNKMNHYRHVTIQILRTHSPNTSYEALIDQNGKVTKTWARTKFEPVGENSEVYIEL
ncbi:hypothetical protein M899_0304 [Bacteriovorax sp. BSW11_IV]|uniref:hypothetical protein n=1 Tax=Bacteriovorax sp. BSW11_IV TaxID=1353529 RepID=UPI00038A401F|nr:hypothetical protein [Bacteriovorax sp. BSW11_IV]EQC50270.1 hypothetical protein M899_0304 [Bacteriovorax sp. BSW11_IV]